MKLPILSLAAAAVALLSSCAPSRTAFVPDNSQPTVGMPAQLSERERTYIPNLDGTLRGEGYLPVRHGAGEMQLQFEIAEGPINTDTTIQLYEGRRLVATGSGRAAGAPMFGRAKVADKSFNKAYDAFKSSLSGSSRSTSGGHSDSAPAPATDQEYVY